MCEGLESINLVQDRVKRRAVVNTGVNIWGSIKGLKYLELLCDYQLLKNDIATWSQYCI